MQTSITASDLTLSIGLCMPALLETLPCCVSRKPGYHPSFALPELGLGAMQASKHAHAALAEPGQGLRSLPNTPLVFE
jgi:hypothetical protein